jgi:REP element-mobilizing transposase RayT
MKASFIQRLTLKKDAFNKASMNRKEPIFDGMYYHVYNRANRKQKIFGDKSDYLSCINKIQTAAVTYGVRVIAYTLMPNHFHMVLVQTEGGSIRRFMNSLETSIAKRFDLKYGHVGHLFQSRYRYIEVKSAESLLVVARYVHLNAVDAGLIRRPEDWPYSDFAAWVSLANKDEGVLHPNINSEEGRLLHETLPYNPRDYVSFVREGMRKENIH